jgi:phosphoglycolate phosphatase
MGRKRRRYDGIIFDMDNTLLQSRIDFGYMKNEVYRLLLNHRVLTGTFDPGPHTTVTLLDAAANQAQFTSEVHSAVWRRIAEIERIGMKGANLEEGAIELLDKLRNNEPDLLLAVFTNNDEEAAAQALGQTGIDRYFDLIVGRGPRVPALKPAPDGVRFILGKYEKIPADRWVSVGDSWTDGKAAVSCGVPFVAYRADLAGMHRRDVAPAAVINTLIELEPLLYE